MKWAARTIGWALAAAAMLPSAASAQIFERATSLAPADVDLLDATSATHLENARRFLAEKQWAEAVDAIRRAMEGDTARFVRVGGQAGGLPEGFERLVPIREYCQWRLAALASESPDALAHYRGLADPLAEQWYAQAAANRDERLLRRIVAEALATKVGDDSLLRLGDAATERGEYAEARANYERIGPNLRVPAAAAQQLGVRQGAPAWLALRNKDFAQQWPQLANFFTAAPERLERTCPDTDLAAADVRARLVLTSILEGSLVRAKIELEIFRRLHGDAVGALAGRQGNLAELLGGLLSQASSWPLPKPAQDWTTFAGSPSRSAVAAGPIDLAGKPRWTFPLPRLTSDRDLIGAGRLRVADDMKGLFSYFPLVVGETVLLRVDARGKSYVTALDLASGEKRWQIDLPRFAAASDDDDPAVPWEINDAHPGPLRHVGVARYTLTTSGHKLFARMGSPVTISRQLRMDRQTQVLAKEQGFLMGYDLATEGKPLHGFPIRPESSEWSFEGTPLCDGGNLYVAMRRVEQGRCQLHVACFALATSGTAVDDSDDNSRPSGRMLWRTKICSAGTLGGGDIDELSHLLLTLDSGTLFVNTSLGAVAAIDAADGRARWIVKYPRASFRSGDPDRHDDQFFRDLTPCLPAGDLVICAPADCDRVFALERGSGELAWTTAPGVAADVVHLLGARGDWLIASGDRLYWLDVHSGKVQVRFPNTPSGGPMQAAANPRGAGRGILAGENIYWPTRETIFVFRQTPRRAETGFVPEGVGEIPLVPRGANAGNLVFARGTLLIAAGDKLYAFDAVAKGVSAAEDRKP